LPIIKYMTTSFFKNKVVAITGGSDGIGKALVDILISMGANVSTCGRNQDKLYDLQLIHSGKPLHTLVADISRYNDCKNFIDTTMQFFGGIDILINNAGISMRALLKDTDVDVIEKVMGVNFNGTLYCTKLALGTIMERKGIIVGVSSIAGYRGLPGRSGYSASKYAVNGFLEALRTEMIDSGVHVMWVCPGFTASNIRNVALNNEGQSHGESIMDEEKMMSSHKCAEYILHAIIKRKRNLILTFKGKETIFLNKFFPTLADKLVKKFFLKNGKLVR